MTEYGRRDYGRLHRPRWVSWLLDRLLDEFIMTALPNEPEGKMLPGELLNYDNTQQYRITRRKMIWIGDFRVFKVYGRRV